MTDFFKHGNKVYSENLNDGILVGNSFDWTVNMSLPGDTGGVFPNSTTVVKAKVADCSITPNSNLSIGETITNNAGSSQVYRLTVYPNFNRFGGFTFVSLEGDGSVIITEKGGTNPVRNNLDYTNLGNVTELKTLKEYDIVITIPASGVVTGLGFGFQSSAASAEASISQDNVTGLEDDLNNLNNNLNNMNNAKEDKTNKVTSLDNSDTHYPTAKAVKTQVDALSSRLNGLIKVYNFQVAIENWEGQTGRVVTIREAPYYEGYSAFCVLTKAFAVTLSEFSVNSVYANLKVWNIRGSENSQTIKGKIIYYPSSWDE